MKYPIGPHQRAGRRRRRGKTAVLIILLTILTAAASLTTWDKPEPEYVPLPSELGRLHNLYTAMGGVYGEVKAYIEDHPEYGLYITGEKEIPSGGNRAGQD